MSDPVNYDLLCIGNYTKDTIITPNGKKYVDGGAMNYSAHAAARLGCRTAVVTHLAEEDLRVVAKFREFGIDCYYTLTPHSTCMKLEYPTHNPDIRTLTVASTATPITAEEVRDIHTYLAVIGTSFRGEAALDVIQTLKARNVFLGADMQGFVRVLKNQSLIYEAWDELPIALQYLDVVKSDAVEAEYLTGEDDIYKAAKVFAGYGPKEVVLTHKNGLLIYVDGEYRQYSFYSRVLDGRSGRGDTCIGAYMAMRRNLDPFEAGIWAVAVTSLKMEKLGPFDGSVDEVRSLISEKYTKLAQA
jgi:sugar/nucleoside kinase (ribokinase family)